MLLQSDATEAALLERLTELLTDEGRLRAMSVSARAMGKPGAMRKIGEMVVGLVGDSV